jgi:hypothetical protein
VVADDACYRPIAAAVTLLAAIQRVHGAEAVWDAEGTRPSFFDKLFGTDQVRGGLQEGEDAATICAAWEKGHGEHRARRATCLLYPRDPQAPGGESSS